MPSVLVAKERADGETRVAATPETVKGMIKIGLSVSVEAGAGGNAYISDAQYKEAGAEIAADSRKAWSTADIVLKVRFERRRCRHLLPRSV
jgi:NAD(P) transhydrogenase subunit alpha